MLPRKTGGKRYRTQPTEDSRNQPNQLRGKKQVTLRSPGQRMSTVLLNLFVTFQQPITQPPSSVGTPNMPTTIRATSPRRNRRLLRAVTSYKPWIGSAIPDLACKKVFRITPKERGIRQTSRKVQSPRMRMISSHADTTRPTEETVSEHVQNGRTCSFVISANAQHMTAKDSAHMGWRGTDSIAI